MLEAVERVTSWRHTHVKPHEQTLLVASCCGCYEKRRITVAAGAQSHPAFLVDDDAVQIMLSVIKCPLSRRWPGSSRAAASPRAHELGEVRSDSESMGCFDFNLWSTAP